MVDPARRIFVVSSMRFAIVIPVESFIQEVSSVHANPRLQWSDWGGYAVKVDLHPDFLILHPVDTKILARESLLPHQRTLHVRIYDLGKSGQRDIQQLGRWMDEGFRGVILAPKWTAQCKAEEPPDAVHLMGDKLVGFYYVSPHSFKTARPIFNFALDRGGP